MFKVVGFVAFLTIISKFLGLGRDLVIANYFGTSIISDAFNMAYLFTGNLFIIFGGIGGPFYNSIVSVLPKLKKPQIMAFIKDTLLKTFIVLCFIAVALYFAKPYLLSFFVHADQNPEYFKLSLYHINLLLPLIIICGPIGILFAVLNTYKYYVAPSLSPAAVNIALIAAVFIMGDAYSGIALSLGTTLGAALSFVFQLPYFNKIKSDLNKETNQLEIKDTDLKSSIKDYHAILMPALLTTGISQIMVFIDSSFCSSLEEGSWTAMIMGNRLIQMPLGVLLTSFLVPVFPAVAKLASSNDIDGVKRQVQKALKALIAICIPGTIIGAIWAEPLIKIIFERGEFNSRSTFLVSTVVFYLVFSIIPYVMRDTLTRVFYSFGDSRTPFLVSLIAVFIKFMLNAALMPIYGLGGIALATVLVISFNCILLSILLRRKTGSWIWI